MEFRKLTDAETNNLLGVNARHAGPILEVVKKFYSRPLEAVTAIIGVESEYDDEYYQNRVGYVGVYDAQGHEIYPLPGQDREARRALQATVTRVSVVKDASDDEIEEIVVRLATPELYVKA